jgi:hypothetical protein
MSERGDADCVFEMRNGVKRVTTFGGCADLNLHRCIRRPKIDPLDASLFIRKNILFFYYEFKFQRPTTNRIFAIPFQKRSASI